MALLLWERNANIGLIRTRTALTVLDIIVETRNIKAEMLLSLKPSVPLILLRKISTVAYCVSVLISVKKFFYVDDLFFVS